MPKRHRTIIIPTTESLARSALSYLGRFAASEATLRKVLHGKIRQAAMRSDEFATDKNRQAMLQQEIEHIILRHKKSGTLNDRNFATMKVGSLRRAGRSRRFIEQKLTQKGITRDQIKTALTGDDDADPDITEREAALAYARRRRLGQFRMKDGNPEQLRKDLAAMARAGFALGVARDALRLPGEEFEE